MAVCLAFIPAEGFEYSWWWVVRKGLLGGLVAGTGFIVYEMITAFILHADIVRPLRMIAGLLIGGVAFDAWFPVLSIVLTGLGIHLFVALSIGIGFTYLFARHANRSASIYTRRGAGIVFGFGLWILNYYLIAPLFGWYWLPFETSMIIEGLGGHIIFGSLLNWIVQSEAYASRCGESESAI